MRCYLTLILSLFIAANSSAQFKKPKRYHPQKGHAYPRSAIFKFGGGVTEFLGRFDLVMSKKGDMPSDIGSSEIAWVERIRQINPNVLWLSIRDWTNAKEEIRNFPDEWFLRDSKGNKISLYGGSSAWVDYTDFCPEVSFQGKRWRLNEYYAWHMAEVDNRIHGDGVGSQGLYYKGHVSWYGFDDVDMDRNGIDDNNEHGKSWIVNQWVKGVDKFVEGLRQNLDGEFICINTGSGDFVRPDITNGAYFENVNALWSWETSLDASRRDHAKAQQPHIFVSNFAFDRKAPGVGEPSKDGFGHFRFGLARAMLLQEYLDAEPYEGGEHNVKLYYDEYDLDIGWPTSKAMQIESTGNEGYGTWVMFFDDGAAILNADKKFNTVTDADLRRFDEYDGPYWRFLGGQDPEFNNGQKFDVVELEGWEYPGYRNKLRVIGGGIVLVKQPTTVVSDIVVDNNIWATSPGSPKAKLVGDWEGGCYGGAYSPRCPRRQVRGRGPYYSAHISTSGSAVFEPAINIAGEYDIYEWHPDIDGLGNTDYVVDFDGGKKTIAVNQATKTSQWNRLGKFKLKRGSKVTVKASGKTVADAVMFVYADGMADIVDRTPPARPQNVQVK